MNATQTGLLAGLVLGAAGAIGGLVLDGRLDISGVLGRGKDR